MGIRRRIEGRVNEAIDTAENEMTLTGAAARKFLEDLEDGVRIEMYRIPGNEHSLVDFFTGKCDTLPFGLRIVADESVGAPCCKTEPDCVDTPVNP